jgi:ABC-type lipoprotein export system ATPase subunit
LQDIDLPIYRGQITAILGLSGTGKSTLLNLLAGLDVVSQGSIEYRFGEHKYIAKDKQFFDLDSGQPISHNVLRENMGFVFQTPHMLANFDAEYNIGLPLKIRESGSTNGSEIDQKVKQIIQLLGLEKQRHQSADTLSGGQRQRVAVGRALIHNPSLVFADEPTGNLDPKHSQDIIDLFNKIKTTQSTTIIIVTHETCLATACADRILRLKPVDNEGPPSTLIEDQVLFQKQAEFIKNCQQINE